MNLDLSEEEVRAHLNQITEAIEAAPLRASRY